MSLNQVLFGTFVENEDLLLLLNNGFLQALLLFFHALKIRLVAVFLIRYDRLLNIFNLLGHQKHFGLPFPNLHRVDGILFVELNERLFQLNDFFVDKLDFLLDVLFLDVVSASRVTLALLLFMQPVLFFHYSGGLLLVMLLEFRSLLRFSGSKGFLVEIFSKLDLELLDFITEI